MFGSDQTGKYVLYIYCMDNTKSIDKPVFSADEDNAI